MDPIEIKYNISIHMDKIKDLRDNHGIDAEANVYRSLMEEGVIHVGKALKARGFDKEAIRLAAKSLWTDGERVEKEI